MPNQWFDIALVLPIDGQTVYVRRIGVENPYNAVWIDLSATFLLDNGLELPWYFVSKWLPRP